MTSRECLSRAAYLDKESLQPMSVEMKEDYRSMARSWLELARKSQEISWFEAFWSRS
jgi:hypothetical protein